MKNGIFDRTIRLIEILGKLDKEVLNGAEVGVRLAKNAKGLLDTYPKLHLFLIDSYTSFKGKNGEVVDQDQDEIKRKAKEKLKSFENRITWLEMLSVEAAENIPDKSLDYTFIDAGHGYEDVRDDIEAYLPKIRDGGILAGHDFAPGYGGLKKAVVDRFGDGIRKTRLLDVWWVFVDDYRI